VKPLLARNTTESINVNRPNCGAEEEEEQEEEEEEEEEDEEGEGGGGRKEID